MYDNILYLVPDSIENLKPQELIQALQQCGFIADTFDHNGKTHYKPGDEYLHQITFLGCSPVVSLGEVGKTGEEFAHIEFEGPFQQVKFAGGINIKPLKCVKCGHRDTNWQQQLPQWLEQGEDGYWSCPECEEKRQLTDINWRKCAGLGQFFIKVWGIFESEAVPGDLLKRVLRETTQCEWSYFYYRG